MTETEPWVAALEALFRRMAPHFQAEATFNRAKAYLEGLLSSAERKNTWQLAASTPPGSRGNTAARPAVLKIARSARSSPMPLPRGMPFCLRIPFQWVTGDCVYGDSRSLRLWLETLPKGYVLQVSGKEYVNIAYRQHRVSRLLMAVPAAGWAHLSAGWGSKGPRLYDWIRLPLMDPLIPGWGRWLLVRRSLSTPKRP